MENFMPGGYVGGRPKDSSKLSKEPQQIRNRLRRKGKKFQEDLDMYAELAWHKPIAEWDIEELARGRPRDKGGKFRGRTPMWITPAVQQEAKKRLLNETMGKLSHHIDKAVVTIGNLMTSEEVDDKGKPIVDARTKLAAAQFILENFLGKPKAIVELTAGDETKSILASAIILDDGLPQGHLEILDAEIVEDDDMEEMEDGDDA
jgi:hypothetical protein